MKKFKRCSLVLGLLSIVALTGCDTGEIIDSVGEIKINNTLNLLREGFKTTGTLKVSVSYFSDSGYQIPDAELTNYSTTYSFDLTYQNNNDYIGVDRRFYSDVTVDGVTTSSYLFGENAINMDGYVVFRYLDYDNTIAQSYAYDYNGDRAPYGSNGYLNPFLMTQRNDFSQMKAGGFELSTQKASIIFTYLFGTLDEYNSNVTFSTANFDFDGTTLTSAHFVSNNLESTYTTTVPTYKEDGTYLDVYHQTYVRYNYEVNMNFSDIGTANAKDIIAPEAEKEANEPLKNAIENMNKYDSITLSRRVTGYYDYYGEYVGNDEILNIYYMGKDSETPGIYSQALIVDEAGDEMIKPTSPSLNDYYLRPSETTGMLRVYTYSTASQAFSRNASGYSGIDNQFTYDEVAFSLQGVSANIFNYVEDSSDPRGGYYVPTLDNLPYVVNDLFMSTFDIFTPVSGGFVTDVKIYVNEDETCIDSVVATYNQRNQYTGTFRVELSDLGNSHPSFDINLAA